MTDDVSMLSMMNKYNRFSSVDTHLGCQNLIKKINLPLISMMII